jgi:hypothetical protein
MNSAYNTLLQFTASSSEFCTAAWTRITENTYHVISTHQSIGVLAGSTESMSRCRYPASPMACWLDLQKLRHVTATYCSVASLRIQRNHCFSIVGRVCFGRCLVMDLHVTILKCRNRILVRSKDSDAGKTDFLKLFFWTLSIALIFCNHFVSEISSALLCWAPRWSCSQATEYLWGRRKQNNFWNRAVSANYSTFLSGNNSVNYSI